MGKKYLETKENSLESSVLGIWQEAAKNADELDEAKFSPKEIKMAIGVASDKRYAGGNMTGAVKAIEKMKKGLSDHPQVKAVLRRQNEAKLDPVNKKALKKDFDDRKDKDIDNDGDVDSSDKYLAKRRKAVSKAINSGDDFKPHMMYDPKTGKGYEAKKMEDHLRMKKMGYTHEKPKMENYDIGTPENTKAKLDATPGQSSDDWNQQVEMMQGKNNSMREALAKMWGVDEGHNPFDKKEEKKYNKGKNETKTMTGKPMTKVSVDPDMKEKNNK